MTEKPPAPMTIRPSIKLPERKSPNMSIQTPVETLKNKKAFEYYYSLGDERNLTKVGKKFNVSPATITKWSSKFDWVERVLARDKTIGDRLKYETDAETTQTRRDILKVIRALVNNMIVEKDGEVEIVGIKLKDISEMREAYELTERILNPDANKPGDGGAKQQILVNITK